MGKNKDRKLQKELTGGEFKTMKYFGKQHGAM